MSDPKITTVDSPPGTVLYILWDPAQGFPPSHQGLITADGAIGRVTIHNAHLTKYARYQDSHPRDLGIGEHVSNVLVTIPSNHKRYDIYRVC